MRTRTPTRRRSVAALGDAASDNFLANCAIQGAFVGANHRNSFINQRKVDTTHRKNEPEKCQGSRSTPHALGALVPANAPKEKIKPGKM